MESKPSNTRRMNDAERAYVGAMIDGEGYISYRWRKEYRADNGRGYHYYHLTVTNTEPEFLSALLRATGVGTVHLKKDPRIKNKPCFNWYVWTKEAIYDIAEQCAPYSVKCQRFLAAQNERNKTMILQKGKVN